MSDASRNDSTVAVVIVNWNSGAMLCRAIDALDRQSLSCRILVVDNASTDNSIELMSQQFPKVEVIQANANLGFAGGNNLAVRQLSDCDWIAFLNPDAFPEKDWLSQLVAAARLKADYSSFASRVVFDANPDILDGAGDEFHTSGFAWRRGHNLESNLQTADREVFMASATAALYSREAFDRAGGFDERFFCYYEDVDLGVRLRLLGYRSWYVAGAIVRHVGSGITGKGSAFVARHTQRNRIWNYVKNMPAPWFWMLIPLHVLYQALALAHYARQGQLQPALCGTIEALQGLPSILDSRRSVQNSRCVSWREFFRTMRWGPMAPLFRK